MSIRKKVDIGFNRKVRASWLTETLRLTAAGVAVNEIETSLKEQIALENQGKETVRKVFIYLNRVWIQPPDYCMALRDEALEMFRHRPDADSAFLLNWGMCLAAYPFIAHVAESTGRLLRLQGEAQAAQVNVPSANSLGIVTSSTAPFATISVHFLNQGLCRRARNREYICMDKS